MDLLFRRHVDGGGVLKLTRNNNARTGVRQSDDAKVGTKHYGSKSSDFQKGTLDSTEFLAQIG